MAANHQVWLRPNRRALLLGSLPLALLFAVSLALSLTGSGWLQWVWVTIVLSSGTLIGLTIHRMRRPRLAYADGYLLVFLRPGKPIRVPIDAVECFFLGQGSALLPNPLRKQNLVEETSTIVVRLAEAAEEWKHVKVQPTQGLWCDGYITIRGTWCEPITGDLMKRLNERLVEAHREVRSRQEVSEQEVR